MCVLLKSDGLLDLACETRLLGGHLNSVVSYKQFGMQVNNLERACIVVSQDSTSYSLIAISLT